MSTKRKSLGLTTVYAWGDSDEDAITDHTLAQACVAAPDHGTSLYDTVTRSTEKSTSATDKSTSATDKSTSPADKLSDPADELTNPADESTNPADESTNPAGESTNPADELTNPADKLTNRADEMTIPADESTCPVDESTCPADESTCPADESTSLPDKLFCLPDKSTSPADKSTSPADKSTSPADKSTNQADKLSSPTDKSTSPTDKLTSSVNKSTELIKISACLVAKTNWSVQEQASPTEKTCNKVRKFFSPAKRTTGTINNATCQLEKKVNLSKKQGSFSKTIANFTDKIANFTDKTISRETGNATNVLASHSPTGSDSSSLSGYSIHHSTENIPATGKANNTMEDSISSSGNSETPYEDYSLDRKSQRNASSRSKSFPSCQKEDICTDKKNGFKPFENFKWAKSTPNITGNGVPDAANNTSLSCADLSPDAKPSVILRRRSSSFRKTNSIRADLSEFIDKPLLRERGIPPDDICKIISKDHTPNQVKRQGEIYEIIQTERAHCIAIANFIQMCYSKTGQVLLKEEPDLPKYMEYILDYHYTFLERMRHFQQEGVYIRRVGDVFGEHLTGSSVDKVIHAYSVISHCCKFAMNAMPPPTQSCLQSVPLRLTKYQTQLEALNKHSKDEDLLEQTLIFQALTRVKEVLTTINANVDAVEKKQRLSVLQHKLDSKSYLILNGIKFGKMDLNNRRLIHEENVKLRFSSGKVMPAILLILDDVLVFLQETMSGKYQFVVPERIKKVDPLDAYIVREKAGTGDTLFIISSKMKGNITEVTCASARLRNTLVYVLRKAIKGYAEKVHKHIQDEREISFNYAEKSFEAFEMSVNECIAENKTPISDYNDRQDLFKRGVKSRHLLTSSLRSTVNVMRSFSKELECAYTQHESVPENIYSAFPKIIGYLDLAIKLNDVSTGQCSSMSKLELNYSVREKMEELRLQQEIVESEKKKTEQLFAEERQILAIMKAELEIIRLRQEAKEKELKEREQRLVDRAATMDVFLGALLVKNNKIFVPAETSPSDMMNTLVEHYIQTRDTSNFTNDPLERLASRRRLPMKSTPKIISKIVQEPTEAESGDLVNQKSTSKKIKSHGLVLFGGANKLPKSSRTPKSFRPSVSRSHVKKSDETTAKGDTNKSARTRLYGIIYRTIGRSKKTFTPTDASIKASEKLLKDMERSNSIAQIAPLSGSRPSALESQRSANMERESRGAQVRQAIPRRLANFCPST